MIFLRKAQAEEVSLIRDLAEQIWPHTYGAYISPDQIRFMLDKMYNKGELLSQLNNGHVFLIASENQKDVGFASFSLVDALTKTYQLNKLYVSPKAQGKGVGKLLINEVINLASREGGEHIQLNVNRNNNAKAFYLKMGFEIKETVDLDIGSGFFMNDYIMELSIRS